MDKRLHNIWNCMKQRCNNPKHTAAPWYHDKGIRVCPEWNDNYKEFESWALNNGYEPTLTIDRVDSDGDYAPDNCQWITLKENQKRARDNRNISSPRKNGQFMVVKYTGRDGFCTVVKVGLSKKDAREYCEELNQELYQNGHMKTLYGVRVTDGCKEGQEKPLLGLRYYLTDEIFPHEVVYASLINEQSKFKEIVTIFLELSRSSRDKVLHYASGLRDKENS